MKKILVLAAVLAFSVVALGCGGSSAAPSKAPTPATPASTTPPVTPPTK